MSGENKGKYRSAGWFGKIDKDGFMHRSWMSNQGLPRRRVRRAAGHRHLQHLVGADALQRAFPRPRRAREARRLGGRRLPVEFPVMSLGESNMRPTAMLFRNLASMDVEESIRGQPDRRRRAAVRLRQDHARAGDGRGELRHARASWCPAGRCSTASSAAATSAPARICGSFSEDVKAGRDEPESDSWTPRPACRAPPGHCMTMGTASTMASMVEALGLSLPGNAAIPAVDSRRSVLAQLAGRRIVEMVRRRPADVADPDARGLRERHPRERRDRRLDQRGDPPARHRRARRRAAVARRLGSARPRRARPWST